MAYISYNRLWKSEFDNIVSKKDKVQDVKINQLKLKVNDALKNKIGSYDEKKWLEESKAKLLKQIDDEKRANLIMSRMEKQMKKQH